VGNTMPPSTLAAFRDHGRVADTLTGTAPSARALLTAVAAAGVDLDAGVAASMQDLLAGLAPRPAVV
jgi:hypothetical protein